MHLWHLLVAAGHEPEPAAVLSSALLGFLCAARVHGLIANEGHTHATLVLAGGRSATVPCARPRRLRGNRADILAACSLPCLVPRAR